MAEKTPRERHLESVIQDLVDRLAIAVALQNSELLEAITLLPSREGDRELIRSEPLYKRCRGMVRTVITERQRKEAA